jgi:hypothetical protein
MSDSPQSSQQSPMASPVQDLKKLRANSTAATGELREFLERMRGRSAADVLDCVSSSGLFKGLITATIGMAILIALFTVGPFIKNQIFAGDSKPKGTETAEVEKKEEASEGAAKPNQGSDTADGASAPASSDPLTSATAPAGAADALGIGETKQAPLDVNPLESSTDDLLKGLD